MEYALCGVLSLCLWNFPAILCNTGVYTFEAIQHGRRLGGAVPPLHTYKDTLSKIHCASLCAAHLGCTSFALNCTAVERGNTSTCFVFDQYVTDVTDLVTSTLCYVQMNLSGVSLTTVATTMTTLTATTTTTTYQSQVVDIVYGALDMCSTSPSSQKDFLVLTLNGVYIFDNITDLTSGPCGGPLSLSAVFPGYGANLPAIEAVEGVLLYQNKVELYSKGWVYIWNAIPGGLVKQTTRQSYAAYLGLDPGSRLNTDTVQWAALRSKFDIERHFYLGGSELFLHTNQNPRTYWITDQVYNVNNFDMNPWRDIPDNTVAVCGYTDQPMTNFVLIDSLDNVYSYEIDHTNDNLNPTKILTLQNKVSFV